MPGVEQPDVSQDSPALSPAVPDLAIILPAYNEAQGIGETIARVRHVLGAFPFASEILVIDDGSTDGTGQRATETGVRVMTHAWNRGYGAALKTGILATRAPAIMIMDADCTYQPEAIPRLYAQLNGAAMVVGTRRLLSDGVTWIRKPGKWMLNRFASYLVGTPHSGSEFRPARDEARHRAAVHAPLSERLLVHQHDHARDDRQRPST